MTEKRERSLLWASFLLPFLLLLGIYALAGIAPFGEHTLLLADGQGQYQSFFALYQDIFAGRADPFYSFGKLLGGPVAGLYAYYLASPLNLLLLLFPKEQIPLGVDWLILLKLSACGLTMGLYLRHTGRLRPTSLLFTTAYALCDYNNAYAWCVMWLDAVVLLPLVALGIERILGKGRPLLYVLSLALAIISCFYTGYMLCGFSVLYLLWRLLRDAQSLRSLPWKGLGQYTLASLLAGGLSAWMLLPGFLALSGGVPVTPYESVARMSYPTALRLLGWLLPGREMSGRLVLLTLLVTALVFALVLLALALALFRFRRPAALITLGLCAGFFVLWYAFLDVPVCREELQFSERHVFSKLLLGLVPYWEFYDGSPNLYAGSLSLLLGLSFFLNRALTRRERAAGALLFLAVLASACFYLPNLVWHGFEENSCFNYRWSFLFSFVLLMLAERSFSKPEGLSLHALLLPGGAAAAILVSAALRPLWFQMPWMLLTAAAFLALELLLLLRWRRGSGWAGRALCALGITALALTAGLSFTEQAGHSRMFPVLREEIRSEQQRIDLARPGDGSFCRLRKTGSVTNKNDPLLFDYPGVVHFSSSEKRSTLRFVTWLGQHTYLKYWANGDLGESRAADALLNVGRYLGEEAPAGYRALAKGVWENPYALPLAYLADEGADCLPEMDDRICRNLNLAFGLLTGEEAKIFVPVGEGLRFTAEREDPVYLQSWSPAITACTLLSGGETVLTLDELYYPNAVYLGSFAPGTELELVLHGEGEIPPMPAQALFYEDGAALERCVQALTAERCETEILSASRLNIHTASHRERLLVVTLPGDEGWTATLDGCPVPTDAALDVLLALHLPAGEHSVSLRYTPPGLWAGLGIAALSLAVLSLWTLMQRRRRAVG